MTCHKVQGLTIPQIYFCLHKIFGFGIPYTAFTRTPFKANIAIVGVPPRDIFEAIFFKDETGSSMLTRKQREIEDIIRNLDTHIDKDIAAGNVDLKQVEKELLQKMTYEEREDHKQTTKQSQGTAIRQHLRRERLEYLQEWKERLCENTAIKGMLQVCTRFKKVSDSITTWKGSEQEWKTLAQILQGEAEDRRRILYFRSVAVGWMEAKDVDVLSQAREHQPVYSTRDCDGKILYRRECP